MTTEKPAAPPPRTGYVPKPPGKDDLDELSRDQALITDEWTGPVPKDKPKP